jgi:hypothetical protein
VRIIGRLTTLPHFISEEDVDRQPIGTVMDSSNHARGMKFRIVAIRIFVLVFAVVVAIDTLPDAWTQRFHFRRDLHRCLAYLGLWQGDWPLFAPNPTLRNGWIVAEIRDKDGNQAIWVSTDWSKASVWQKFYGARHLNYHQRVVLRPEASRDLADYLQQAIPKKENAVPAPRWNDQFEPLPPVSFAPPIREVALYHHRQSLNLAVGEPIPEESEIVWSQKSSFLVKREYPE